MRDWEGEARRGGAQDDGEVQGYHDEEEKGMCQAQWTRGGKEGEEAYCVHENTYKRRRLSSRRGSLHSSMCVRGKRSNV